MLPTGRLARAWPGATLLEIIARAGLPIARACGGDGLCGRCGVRVLAGGEALPTEGAAEARAKRRNRIDPDLRLACRVVPVGDLVVTAPGWGDADGGAGTHGTHATGDGETC